MTGRYFTITGKHLSGTPLAIQNRQDVLEAVNAELFAEERPVTTYRFNRVPDVSDEKLIERAQNASGGERFQRLWQGDTSAYGNDHSRADLALCRMLAFWCGGDVQRVDRLFRRSGLMRDKWDRRTGDSAYGVRTIKAVLPSD